MGSLRAVVSGAMAAALAAITAPAALADPSGKAPQSGPYGYFTAEGGWAGRNGPGVQTDIRYATGEPPHEHHLDAGSGWYWRGEAGVVLADGAWPGGVLGRVGIVVQGWKGSDREHGFVVDRTLVSVTPDSSASSGFGCTVDSEPCVEGRFSLERRFWEIVPQFFGRIAETGRGRLWLGVEPAFGEFSERGRSAVTNNPDGVDLPPEVFATRRSDLSARFMGISLVLEGEHQVGSRLRLLTRAAAGYAVLDASAEGRLYFDGFSDEPVNQSRHAERIHSFRGQLGLGAEYDVTPRTSLGIIGRLDYWSHAPFFSWPSTSGDQFNRIAGGAMLNGFVGGRLTFRTAGR